MIYLDNAATTRVKEEVMEAMMPYFGEKFYNPSSVYGPSRNITKEIQEARKKIANSIGADENEIYFTSGGSESDNWAIKGIALSKQNKGKHIITSKIEHHAVLETCKELEKQGYEITYINVNEEGIINLEELEQSIKEDTILVSIMTANNEIGVIEPIKEIGNICHKHNILFHTDAVQAYGNIEINVEEMNIDLLSTSAHKIHGPKGIGFLYIKKGIKIDSLINGGNQEKGKRAGTTNSALIMGFTKAVELKIKNMKTNNEYILNLRNHLIKRITKEIPYVKINGSMEQRLPGNINISFRFIEGEGMLLKLDMAGICASSGSACTSGSLDPSHVLLAIGLPHEIAHGSLRISINEENTIEEIDYTVDELKKIINELRMLSPRYEDFVKKEGKINV